MPIIVVFEDSPSCGYLSNSRSKHKNSWHSWAKKAAGYVDKSLEQAWSRTVSRSTAAGEFKDETIGVLVFIFGPSSVTSCPSAF